jgi:serine/threonine protein phosphatase 1
MYLDSEIQPGDVIAVGDIHARYDLLEKLIERVRGSLAVVIFLGDILDRGGEDIAVVSKIRHMEENPDDYGLSNVFCLMGNHEKMFVDAVNGPGAEFMLWVQNGGNFEQFGELQEHLDWFEQLPIYMTVGDTLFIHAGIVPGRDPYELVDKGHVDKLVWMREPFLSMGPQFEKWNPELKQVVFGHTPKFDVGEGEPYTIPDGICVDTGAYFTGVLTGYNVTQETFLKITETTNVEKTAHR